MPPLIPITEAESLAQSGLERLKDQIEYGEVVGRTPRWKGTDRRAVET